MTGENYRFGYKASGDAAELVKLCEEFGLSAFIVRSVMDTAKGSITCKPKGKILSVQVTYFSGVNLILQNARRKGPSK